ncbi:CinA family protein [Microbacterium sp. NPDC064584]|uniref:CinA family protein n=1 Tax=Microbacterium sp. NPDC064584 TaxID=3155817 RepID=UPI0034436883
MTDAADQPTAGHLIARLVDRGWTVAVAESLTGGMVVSSLVDIPGASAVVRGGIVAYATPLKSTLLGVDAALLTRQGAVDPLVAAQMAAGVRFATRIGDQPTDVGIATTGVAGPAEQDGHAVGTVFVAVETPSASRVVELALSGSRERIRAEATAAAVRVALELLS